MFSITASALQKSAHISKTSINESNIDSVLPNAKKPHGSAKYKCVCVCAYMCACFLGRVNLSELSLYLIYITKKISLLTKISAAINC